METIRTADEVISRVGPMKFARWAGVDKRVVSKWRKRGFPAAAYIELSSRLRNELNLIVPPSAFGMRGTEPVVPQQGQAA
jgi:hypothetical protein